MNLTAHDPNIAEDVPRPIPLGPQSPVPLDTTHNTYYDMHCN